MLLIIEITGTKESVEDSNRLKELAEDDYGYTVEVIPVGGDAHMIVYDEDMKSPITFNTSPSDMDLNLYLKYTYDEE